MAALARLSVGRHLGPTHDSLGGSLDRRSFLDTLTTLGMFGGLRGAVPFAGTIEAQSRLVKGQHLETIGIQLYSVRRELARDFEGTLARVASIGYREVEFAGYFDRRPEQVRAILDRYRLAAPSVHVPIEVARQDWAGALAAANVIGHRYVVLPWLPPESRRMLDDFKRLAAECNRLGEEAKSAGLRFAYHNHDFEFVPLEGRIPYDVLLAETDPGIVAFELDLMWITKGGQDPVRYFARYPARFELVHIKDSTGAPDYRHVDVGRGTIDFRRILTRRHQAGIRHFFVEHDDPADPLTFARASYEYLKRLGLGKP
jgi:sugar phosphate isomerase/epimerase